VENTFTSIPTLVDKLFPVISSLKGLVLANFWPSDARISSVKCPILFISGEQDELIPPAHMKQLYSLATSATFATFVGFTQLSVPGGDHNSTWQSNIGAYLQAIREFMDKSIRTRL